MKKIAFGQVPKDISGTYIKNGPNTKFENPGAHWFDGAGMVHAFNFKDGELLYSNKWIETEIFKNDLKAGKATNLPLGKFSGWSVLLVPLTMVMIDTGFRKGPHRYKGNTANTAIISHAKHTHACLEADYPFDLKL